MKSIINSFRVGALLFLAVALVFSACKKDENQSSGTPVISSIRAISPAPNDSTLSKVGPGQLIVIQGQNLRSVTNVYFNGFEAAFNVALVADNNLVVTVPSIDFTNLPAGEENVIKLISKAGQTTYNFPVLPPPPVLSSVSNEYAMPGEELTIYGQYLYLINKIVFPGGVEGTNIKTNSTGNSLKVTIPNGATSGNITLDAKGGKATYVSYNDKTTGIISNFDNVNNFQYWSASQTNDATLFPGATGNYVRMNFTSVGINDQAWYNGGRSINLNPVQWVPKSMLAEPTENFALKFEIFVKEPWKTGSMQIRTDEYVYIARYEPWKTAPDNTFTTQGWTTVVMPLSQFKSASAGLNGTGTSVGTLTELLGPEGNKPMTFMFYNDSTTPIAKFDAAVDNIRIVKIK